MFILNYNKNTVKNQEAKKLILSILVVIMIFFIFFLLLEKSKNIFIELATRININYIIFLSFSIALYKTIEDIIYFVNRKKIDKICNIREKIYKRFYFKKIVKILNPDEEKENIIIKTDLKKIKEIEKIEKKVNNYKEEKKKKIEIINIIDTLKLIG